MNIFTFVYIFNNIYNREKQEYPKLVDLTRFILDLLVIVNYLSDTLLIKTNFLDPKDSFNCFDIS